MTFDTLYQTLLRREMRGEKAPLPAQDERQLDCLLHPE